MTKETTANELASLVSEVREHLLYFQELGVELVAPAQLAAVATRQIASPSVKREQASPKLGPVGQPNNFQSASVLPTAVPPVIRRSAALPNKALIANLFAAPEKLTQSSETFEEIHAEIGNCTLCSLCELRKNVVHTEGNRKARLMFVGEAPGADEDVQARPFVGRAGQLLTKIIEAIGFKREEVLIGNINRCRPPGNRPPTPEEAAICKPFLLREIASVQPSVIVVMGNTAMRNLLDTKETIGRMRGQFHDYKGIKVMPTFHPAYLLRDPSKKRETWDDLKKVRALLDDIAKQPA